MNLSPSRRPSGLAILCLGLAAGTAAQTTLQKDAANDIGALLVETERWQTLGRLDDAAKCAMAALAKLNARPDPRLSSIALSKLAFIAMDQGRFSDAESLARKALAIVAGHSGTDSADYAVAAGNLASVLIQEAKYIQADPLSLAALKTGLATFGAKSKKYADLLGVRAQLYCQQEKYREAINVIKGELVVRNSLAPNPEQLGQTYQNLAVVYERAGKLRPALAAIQKADALWRSSLPANSQSRLFASNTRLAIYDKSRQFEQANKVIQTLLPRAEELLGSDHPELAVILNNVGMIYEHQKRHTEAAAAFQRAHRINFNALGQFHPNTAYSLMNYGATLRAMGQGDEGRELERQARVALSLVH